MSIGSKLLAGFLVLFGAATIKSGGSVLFDEAARAAAGNIIPTVVWFNTFVGPLYIIGGIAVWRGAQCANTLASRLFFAYLLVDGYLIYHIVTGGLYEMRTVYAMALRTAVWAFTAYWLKKNGKACAAPSLN